MKPEVTILSDKDYKKYFQKKNWNKEEYRNFCAYTPNFWSLVTENQNDKKNLFMTTTREVDDNNKIGIIVNDINHEIEDSFSSLDNTEKIAVKPVIKNPSELSYKLKITGNEFDYFEYGVYPSKINKSDISDITNRKLARAYRKNKLIKTGKEYTIGFKKYEEYAIKTDYEYISLGNMAHVLFSNRAAIDVNLKYLSTRKFIRFVSENPKKIFHKKKVHWIEVEEIVWVFTKNNKMAIADCNVFSGVPLTLDNQYHGNFEKTYLYDYLNNTFAKEILPIKDYFIEKSMEKVDMDKKTKKIFYKLVENDEICDLKNISTKIMLYYIKEKYNDLKEEEYEKLVIASLKYISLTENNYFYQEVKKETEKRKLEISLKEDKKNAEEKLKKYNDQTRLNNKTTGEIKEEVLKNISSDMTSDEIIEVIYSMYPYLKNEELTEILNELDNKPKVLVR